MLLLYFKDVKDLLLEEKADTRSLNEASVVNEKIDPMQIGAVDVESAPYRNMKLSMVFNDLRIGEVSRARSRPVCRSLYSNDTEPNPVLMLKMSHFTGNGEGINWDMVREDLLLQEQLEELQYVDRGALLEADDLLLNMRGQSRVFRMSEQMLDEMPGDLVNRGLRFASTNNFVLMRPNPQYSYGPYIFIMMQILMENLHQEWQNIMSDQPSAGLMHQFFQWKYTAGSSVQKAAGLPLGVRELKEISIDMPADHLVQRQLVHRYNVLLYNERMAREKSEEYRYYLNSLINPNIIP
jgi:hypothetical protein